MRQLTELVEEEARECDSLLTPLDFHRSLAAYHRRILLAEVDTLRKEILASHAALEEALREQEEGERT